VAVREGIVIDIVAPEARSDEDTETRTYSMATGCLPRLHQRLDPTRILKLDFDGGERYAEIVLHQRLDPTRILKRGMNAKMPGSASCCTRGSIRRGY